MYVLVRGYRCGQVYVRMRLCVNIAAYRRMCVNRYNNSIELCQAQIKLKIYVCIIVQLSWSVGMSLRQHHAHYAGLTAEGNSRRTRYRDPQTGIMKECIDGSVI